MLVCLNIEAIFVKFDIFVSTLDGEFGRFSDIGQTSDISGDFYTR